MINRTRTPYPQSTNDTTRCSARKPRNASQNHAYGITQSSSNREHRPHYLEKSMHCHSWNYKSWPSSSKNTSPKGISDPQKAPTPHHSSLSKRKTESYAPYKTIDA